MSDFWFEILSFSSEFRFFSESRDYPEILKPFTRGCRYELWGLLSEVVTAFVLAAITKEVRCKICSQSHTQLINLYFLFPLSVSVLQHHQTPQWSALRARLLFWALEQSEVLRQYVSGLPFLLGLIRSQCILSAAAQVFWRGLLTLHVVHPSVLHKRWCTQAGNGGWHMCFYCTHTCTHIYTSLMIICWSNLLSL